MEAHTSLQRFTSKPNCAPFSGHHTANRSISQRDVHGKRPTNSRAWEACRAAQYDEVCVSTSEVDSRDVYSHQSVQSYTEIAAASCCSGESAASSRTIGGVNPVWAVAGLGAAALASYGLKQAFWDKGSREYEGNVGAEYDAWTNEGLLEYYWGEHIHLGYYTDEDRARGYKKKDFKQAKFEFTDRMLEWSGAQQPKRILDVGCGFGGTSRMLAKRFPDAQVDGITLSQAQVKRGTELAEQQGVPNVKFQVMDALNMWWEDNTFDLVWACESGEHMPDKRKYVEEMTRVLKPGGRMVIATWCQREETAETPFSGQERKELQFLYDEWAHPFFVSIEEYGRIMNATGTLDSVETADWTDPTLPTWRHSIWVGVYDPWIVIFKLNPLIWIKTVREIICIERMHRAFDSGLMRYGMMKAVKKPQEASAQAASELVGAASSS